MKLTITPQFKMYLETLSISLGELLERAGIPNLLWKDELVIDTQQYYRLLQEFDQTISDSDLIRLAHVKHLSTFIPPIYAALSSKNGVQALERFAKFKKLVGPIVLNIQTTSNVTSIGFSYVTNEMLPRFAVIQEQLLLLNLIRTGTGSQIKPLMISSPYEYSKEVLDEFKIPAEIDESNVIVFDNADLEKNFLTQNNVMWEFLEPGLNLKLSKITDDNSFKQIVEATLIKKIPSGSFVISDVAESLGTSVRTLQRKLSAENVSFNQLVKNAQKLLSFNFLNQKNLTLEEIAYLVGYSDVSSFSRAFKKWSGMTISDYRTEIRR